MKLYPILILRNCNPVDPTFCFFEVKGDSIEAAYEAVGGFVMEALQIWGDKKRETGMEPHVRIEPRRLTRIQIDELEAELLINDPRTFTRGT